jgi:hydroxymethylpyrimidine pyrophosphatase-like HAD family hydrolase
MKYQLIISDFDGTLGQAPTNNIDDETLDAIRKFTEKGGIFAICSGRETSSIMRILIAHNIDCVVASFQGARITDMKSGKVIFKGGLSAKKALEALDAVAYSKLTPIAYGESELYVQEKNPYVANYETAVRLDGKVTDIREEVLRQGEDVSKICWLGDDKVVCEVAKTLNEKYG